MPILAPFEQIAQEKGIQIGEERGIQIGEERGIQIGEERGSIKEAQVTIIDILNEEFGEIPPSLIKSIKSIDDLPSLRKLRKDALKVDSLKEFKQHMEECKKQESL